MLSQEITLTIKFNRVQRTIILTLISYQFIGIYVVREELQLLAFILLVNSSFP